MARLFINVARASKKDSMSGFRVGINYTIRSRDGRYEFDWAGRFGRCLANCLSNFGLFRSPLVHPTSDPAVAGETKLRNLCAVSDEWV
jgi:hypothetical protein